MLDRPNPTQNEYSGLRYSERSFEIEIMMHRRKDGFENVKHRMTVKTNACNEISCAKGIKVNARLERNKG